MDAAGPSDRFAKVKLPCHAPTAVMLIRSQLCSAKGATGAGCGARLGVRGCRKANLYSRFNFKLNRAAVLVDAATISGNRDLRTLFRYMHTDYSKLLRKINL